MVEFEQADDAVGVAHRRHFRVGHHDGRVGVAHGERRAPLDAGRAVADDPIEERPELADYAVDAVLGERVLVPRLRGGEQEERIDALVANERLRQLGHALDDVDQVVDHAPLGPHEEIEIAQADIEVDDGDPLAAARESRAERSGRGCLADATLTGRHHQHVGHVNAPFLFSPLL